MKYEKVWIKDFSGKQVQIEIEKYPQLICSVTGKKMGGCEIIDSDYECQYKEDCLYQLKHGPGIHSPRRKKEGVRHPRRKKEGN